MSHIFDGLQRLEGERSGTDTSVLPGVTELLQHAERQAASKWCSAVQTETLEITESISDSAFVDPTVMLTGLTAAQRTQTAVEPSSVPKFADLFTQFQSLQISLPPQSRLPSFTDSDSPPAEAFNLLGVRLRHLTRIRPLKKLLITSTIPQEGKSTVSANLACTLALKTNQRVLVLEGDLRRPSLSQIFGLERHPGLSELLESDHSLSTSIYRLEGPNLWILPAGKARSNALELLQSGKLSVLMNQLTTLFDWIIIDSPPVLPLADTSVWMRLADGIILTTRQGITEKRQLQRGLEAIEHGKLIGALVNSSKNAGADNYYYAPQTSRSTD
jgi:capsular exopolysaccharide synthesis family protein